MAEEEAAGGVQQEEWIREGNDHVTEEGDKRWVSKYLEIIMEKKKKKKKPHHTWIQKNK